MRGGKAIVPVVNLVTNLGFRPDATHTTNADDSEAALPTSALPTPLAHPATDIDTVRDEQYRRQFLLPPTPPAHPGTAESGPDEPAGMTASS
ncbi:hypothetical protein [Streptomyces sp. NPDC001222]|uniref:hypothetical protein n=1 Tax=Streptomyces sp. NPDC001222 TaxID=3364548 RepID=UPI00368E2859